MSAAWLVRFHPRHHHAKARPRWLTADGGFSSDPAEALVVDKSKSGCRAAAGVRRAQGLAVTSGGAVRVGSG